MIYVIATLTMKPGALDNLMASALPFIAESRKEDGCLAYDLHRSLTSEDTLVVVERWRDMDALQAHLQSAHMDVWRESGRRYVTDTAIEIITPESVEKR